MRHLQKSFTIAISIFFAAVCYAYDFEIDGYRYTVITSSTAEFAGVNPDYEGEVVIPEYVSYSGKQLSVNTIGERAFENFNSSFLRIPQHISLIKNSAFYNAQIDSLHFDNSDNSISLQNTINRGPSMSYSKLGSVYIGRQINRTDYNSNANGPFYNSSVKKVYIGKTCSFVQELFQNCSSLEKVIMKDDSYIEYISGECFRNCHQLMFVDLRKGLTTISSLAFYNCTSLDSIYIPSTVTSIASNAFSEAKNIKKVVSASNAPVSISETAFPGIVYLSSTLYVPIGSKSKYESTTGWKEFSTIVETKALMVDKYKLTYLLNGEVYKQQELEYGAAITPEPAIEQEGHTFSGWSEIPATMPAHDVTVVGTLTVNKYVITYIIDGREYKTFDVEYGATIIPEPIPSKEGYTFSGWSYIPTTMPAHDVTVTGSFIVNKYKLAYLVDGEVYKVTDVDYGSVITPEPAPTREGHTFSGWSGIPTIMPAHDVTVTGSFTINQYMLTYKVDGVVYKTYKLDYGTKITPEPVPVKEGYTFSGWSEIPETMPAHDVTVMGSFIANKYKLTYVLDWQEIKTTELTFGTTITPEQNPTKEGYTFTGWSCLPDIMPDHDVTVYGAFYQSGKFMHGFRWEEEEMNSTGAPQITLAVGDKYLIHYSFSSSEMPDDIFFLTQAGNWVAYERKNIPGLGNTDVVVECPEVFSISPSGVITAHKEGLAALKPTGYIQRGEGSDRCYINVVANYEEKEPNNNVANANELKGAFTRFSLYNISDQDFFKVKAKAGDKITFKLKGSHYSHLGYRWSTFSPSGVSLGSGGLAIDESTGEREITISDALTKNVGSGYYYLQIYFNQSLSEYFTYNDYLDVQVFINDEPIQQKFPFKLKYVVDGNEYLSYMIEEGVSITPESTPNKEGYTFSGWSEIPTTMPAHNVTVTGSFTVNKYKLTYVVDGQVYKTQEVEYGTSIIPEPAPTKEGHTFSGWSEIPATMPSHDVIVTGTFTINQYMLTYKVDGMVYKTFKLDFGTIITPEPVPVKEGYTFSGWSEIPETMPAYDLIVNGSFTINKYKLTYMIDNQMYKTFDVEYNAAITQEPAPTKEGYTFSGWSGIPERMPAHDVTVTGTFMVNKYILMYILDGKEYKKLEVDYGAVITPEPDPEKEGYTFSGWSEIPKTMPARTVIITGTFTINSYRLTYLLNGEEYKQQMVAFGTPVTPEPAIDREGHTFSGWSEIPATMPAHDVTVTGTLTVNKYVLAYILDGREYKTLELDYGTIITPEPAPEKEGYTFSGWIGLPETMPARFVIVTGTFTINSYMLTYIIDGEVYKQVQYEYGATITPEPQPEGDYKTFEWVGVPATMPAHDVIATAVYETGIAELLMMAEQGKVRVYSPNGKLLSRPQKGLNIIVLPNGTVHKVVVK